MEKETRHERKELKTAVPFTTEEAGRIQQQLDENIEFEHIQYRPSAQGSVAYVEGWKALSLANEVFGFNGWSSEILSISTDFVDVDNGRVSLGISCMVRVTLRDGTFHEDIGYGTAENQRGRAAAFEKARKEAVTDAMKRALRMFGNRLGNCAYDKAFLKQAKMGKVSKPQPVTLASTVVPMNFTPKWQHPKSAPSIPPSEADSEPVVTEERTLHGIAFII